VRLDFIANHVSSILVVFFLETRVLGWEGEINNNCQQENFQRYHSTWYNTDYPHPTIPTASSDSFKFIRSVTLGVELSDVIRLVTPALRFSIGSFLSFPSCRSSCSIHNSLGSSDTPAHLREGARLVGRVGFTLFSLGRVMTRLGCLYLLSYMMEIRLSLYFCSSESSLSPQPLVPGQDPTLEAMFICTYHILLRVPPYPYPLICTIHTLWLP
jgi:hypothetical protein